MPDNPIPSIREVKELIWKTSLRGGTSLELPFNQVLSMVVDLAERQYRDSEQIEELEDEISDLEAKVFELDRLKERNEFLEAENARLTQLMANQLVIPFKEG